MKFGAVEIERVAGMILGHNVADGAGRRVLRKGKVLSAVDIAILREIGRSSVYVAQLEDDDVDENAAAWAIATAVSGRGVRLGKARTGRVNVYAAVQGVVRVDTAALVAVNRCYDVTLAVLRGNAAVAAGKMVATLKIIPYGVPNSTVIQATTQKVVAIDPLHKRKVGLILSGFPTAKEKIVRTFRQALEPRVNALGSAVVSADFVPLEDEADEAQLANMIRQRVTDGCELIILAGETAIMDRYDIAPRAVERAGGDIVCLGAPVDPGNLLMLAYVAGVPVIGAPGCARSPKANIVDIVLPRLLVGDQLTHEDIILLGHGGLLDDVPERPLPRSAID